VRFLIIFISVVLSYGAFQQGAVTVFDGMCVAVAIGLAAGIYFGLVGGRGAPPGNRLVTWAVFGLLSWGMVQLIPLPPGLIAALSPHRTEVAALAGERGWVPISVTPVESRIWLIRLGTCLSMLLLARDLTWRRREASWFLALPVLIVAGWEALLGVVQFFSAASGSGTVARGTYVNRDHFSGLLEMGIPLVVMAGIGIYQQGKSKFETPVRGAVIASCMFGLAAAMLMAVVGSLSRMGFVATLSSLLFIGVVSSSVAMSQRLAPAWRWIPVVLVSLLIACSFVFLPTDELIARFARTANDDLTADMRVQIWKESIQLVKQAPLTGFGLGSYQSAFYAHKKVAPMNSVEHAHNDYIQGAVELGLAGMIPLLLLGAVAVKGAWGGAALPRENQRHYLSIGCAGSIFALILHSLVDFNLYIPANALALAWICGIGAGMVPGPRRKSGDQAA